MPFQAPIGAMVLFLRPLAEFPMWFWLGYHQGTQIGNETWPDLAQIKWPGHVV